MASKIILHEFEDWDEIKKKEEFIQRIDMSREENFGIHPYKGKIWTSGYVGVGRLYGYGGRPLVSDGKEHVAVINSKYHVDPWKMLEKVMADKEEYDDYVAELEKNGKFLFKVFYDQSVIKLDQDQEYDADVLYALSFINSCFDLCKKGVKKRMIHQEDNYNARIRGRIDIRKNIRKNTVNGRNDRFYCKYIDFTADTIENRILKATLIKCKGILGKKFELKSEVMSRLHYCLNVLKGVSSTKIKIKDFNDVVVTGLYIYYKPLIKQAKAILTKKLNSYKAEGESAINKSVFVIPYMINMESLFEFYVRTVLKEILDSNKYYVRKFSEHILIEKGITRDEDALKGIHLMSYCIPDIIIVEKTTGKPAYVFDVKYKSNAESQRNDSHQLLSYVLLTGVKKCGFIFPGEKTEIKKMRNNDSLDVTTPFIPQLQYYELIVGNKVEKTVIDSVIA